MWLHLLCACKCSILAHALHFKGKFINRACLPAGFITLLDNYERSSGVAEVVTAEELGEINLFLDAVLATEVMKVYLTNSTLHLRSSYSS